MSNPKPSLISKPRWNAYAVGAAIGILSWIAFAIVNKPLGISTSIFGARLADGCTSGHGISGSLQLAVSSWTFFLALFAAGVVTTSILFGLGGSRRSN